MIHSYDHRNHELQRATRDLMDDKEAAKAQQPNTAGLGNPNSSHTNLNVSNLSNVQKELRPNKIVNKGNSVFQNHHKLLHNAKNNMPIKAIQHYDPSQQQQ